MAAPKSPAFDPFDVAESNATGYPEPFASMVRRRWNRRLGAHAGLTNFGVVLTRIEPGGRSSCRHTHLRQDEFVWVLEGEVVMVTDAGRQVLEAGTCAGFPAGGASARLPRRSGFPRIAQAQGPGAPEHADCGARRNAPLCGNDVYG